MANLPHGISVKMWEQNNANMQEGQGGFHMHFLWCRQMCSQHLPCGGRRDKKKCKNVASKHTHRLWCMKCTQNHKANEKAACECNLRWHLTMKVLTAKGKGTGTAQLRDNRRKRCSHTKEFWVRKGHCALPHVDVLRQKGLAPDILLGPCCLWATREVAIKLSILRINDFSWVHKNSQQNSGDKSEL